MSPMTYVLLSATITLNIYERIVISSAWAPPLVAMYLRGVSYGRGCRAEIERYDVETVIIKW